MSKFVLIPGAGGAGWAWHLVAAGLQQQGHEAVAVDLPGADETAGLPEYTGLVVDAIGGHTDTVLVALSMGAFTAAQVCARVPVRLLVLLNAMIPAPGETAGQWWEHTGWEPAWLAAATAGGYPTEVDLAAHFLHDVPPGLAAVIRENEMPEAEVAFSQPCAIERWPEVPTRVVAGRDERFFPLDFQRRLARERLGVTADETPGGHMAPLSRPRELTERLAGYLAAGAARNGG